MSNVNTYNASQMILSLIFCWASHQTSHTNLRKWDHQNRKITPPFEWYPTRMPAMSYIKGCKSANAVLQGPSQANTWTILQSHPLELYLVWCITVIAEWITLKNGFSNLNFPKDVAAILGDFPIVTFLWGDASGDIDIAFKFVPM